VIKFKNEKYNKTSLSRDEKLELVPIYGNAILEDDIVWCCGNCKHYDFEDNSMQICNNENNHQLLENKWYKMMVTPDFCCNEYKKV